MIDPMEEYAFTIIHPGSGDRAYADTREAAEVARFTLERDFGMQTRERAYIVHRPQEPK